MDITTGNNSILVGIIDSGIDGKHPDLIDNINDNLHRDFVNVLPSGEEREIDKVDLEDLN